AIKPKLQLSYYLRAIFSVDSYLGKVVQAFSIYHPYLLLDELHHILSALSCQVNRK
ncbi:hypothetical protein Ancab_005466, partial [Ancistrocladus abbreviatus]